MQIYSYADCYAAHDDWVYKTNICAGVPEMGKAECNGDSGLYFNNFNYSVHWDYCLQGGPLLVNGVQVGVVSWSIKPCAIAPFPGVYTDVTHFIDWIQTTTAIDFQMNMFLTKNKWLIKLIDFKNNGFSTWSINPEFYIIILYKSTDQLADNNR